MPIGQGDDESHDRMPRRAGRGMHHWASPCACSTQCRGGAVVARSSRSHVTWGPCPRGESDAFLAYYHREGGLSPPHPNTKPRNPERQTRRGKPGDQNPRTSPSKPNKSSELKAHKTTRRPRQSCPRSPRTAGLEAKMEASLIGIQVGHFALAFKTTPPEAPNHMALTTLGHQTQRHEQHSHDTRRDDGQEDAQPTRGPSPSTTRVLGQPAHSTPRGPQVHLGGRSSRPSHATSGNPAKDTTRPHPQSAHQAQLYTSTLEARQRGLTRGGPNAALLDPASTRPWHARHHYRRVRGRCDGQARKPDSNTAWHDRTTPCCHQHPKACGPDDQ